jgi:hypothetical protein
VEETDVILLWGSNARGPLMPGNPKFSTFSFEGDFNRFRNAVTGVELTDKTLALVWTIVRGRQRNL